MWPAVVIVLFCLLGGLVNAGIIGATSSADAVPFGTMSDAQEGNTPMLDVGLDEWSRV